MNLYDLLTIDRSSLYWVRRGLGSIADLLPRFQSTRPMRGATPAPVDPVLAELQFQSTRPMRGATLVIPHIGLRRHISIHAPLAGRDSGDPTHRSAPPYFNPRTPCGVRRGYQDQITAALVFQSTRPMRGATIVAQLNAAAGIISIHAPHAGRDVL